MGEDVSCFESPLPSKQESKQKVIFASSGGNQDQKQVPPRHGEEGGWNKQTCRGLWGNMHDFNPGQLLPHVEWSKGEQETTISCLIRRTMPSDATHFSSGRQPKKLFLIGPPAHMTDEKKLICGSLHGLQQWIQLKQSLQPDAASSSSL